MARLTGFSRRAFIRNSALAFTALAASATLGACAAPPPPTPTPAPAPKPAEAPKPAPTAAPAAPAAKPAEKPAAGVKIVHWQHHSQSRKDTVDKFIGMFKEKNPSFDFQFESIPWADYWDKLYAALAANQGPDTFQIPMGLIPEFVAGGQIVPIDPAYVQGNPLEEFLPWTIERLKDKGKLFGLPLDVQTFVLYVNDALAKAAGLDISKPPKDWGEAESWARAMTKKTSGNTEQIGADLGYYSAWSELLLQQSIQPTPMVDPQKLTVNWSSNEAYTAFTYAANMVKNYDDPAFLKGQPRFALGKAGMTVGHPVSRGTYARQAPDLKYTIHPYPSPAGKPLLTIGSHWAWVVNKDFKQPDKAWQWVSYVTSEDAQKTWYEVAGDLPSRKKHFEDPAFRKTPNDVVVMDSMKYASPWAWIGWAEWVKLYGDAIERVVLTNEDPKKSLDLAAEEANRVIKKHLPKG